MMIIKRQTDILYPIIRSIDIIHKYDCSLIYKMAIYPNKNEKDTYVIKKILDLFHLAKYEKNKLVCSDGGDISNGHESLIKLPASLYHTADVYDILQGQVNGYILGEKQLLFTYITHRRDSELKCGNVFFDNHVDIYEENFHKPLFNILVLIEKYSRNCLIVYKGIANIIHYNMSTKMVSKVIDDIYWPLQKILQVKDDELNTSILRIKNGILSSLREKMIPSIQIAIMHTVTNFSIRKYAVKGKVLSRICYADLSETQKKVFAINLPMFFSHKFLPYNPYIIQNTENIFPKFMIDEEKVKELKHKHQLIFDIHKYIKMKYNFDNLQISINRYAVSMIFKLPVMIYLFYIIRHWCRYFYIIVNDFEKENADAVFLLPFISI